MEIGCCCIVILFFLIVNNILLIIMPHGHTHIWPGRITEFKVDQPGHSVSMACTLHSKCRKVLLLSKLPATFQVPLFVSSNFRF